jgi:hypothetical protein
MARKVNRTLGIIMVLSAAGVGALAVRQGRSSTPSERSPGEVAAEAARKRVEDALRARYRAVESRATAGAGLPPLRAALDAKVDGPTLVDLFQTEDWWRSFRDEFVATRVVVGDQVATFGKVEMRDEDRGLVAGARKSRVASQVLSIKGRPFFAAAARIDALEEFTPVLVLLKPFEASAVQELADASQSGVMLSDARAAIALGGAPEQKATLQGLAGKDVAVVAHPEGMWGAARIPLAPPLVLWAVRAAPEGAPRSGGSSPILWGGAGLLALFGLGFVIIGGRSQSGAPIAVIPETTLPFGTAPKQPAAVVSTPAERAKVPAASANPPSSAKATVPNAPLPVASRTPPSQPPQSFGRYKLVSRLGEGGMSEIYKAVAFGAEGFSRTFVLKRLRPELARDKEAVTQFIDEARVQASLVHSNIVPVFDFGMAGEEYYMTQEYITGRDLFRLATRCVERTGFPLEPRLVYYLAHETLQALAFAHERIEKDGKPMGIIHRDVSAGNILLSATGEVKLVDFGIAKANKRMTKTQVGMVKGNANFMAPEQARGQPVDTRSDLFSLGAVMYFCFRNELLYDGPNDLDVLYRAASGPTPENWDRISHVPPPGPEIMARALALDPDNRYQSAREFAEALAPHISGMKNAAASLMDLCFADEFRAEAV